MCQVNICLQDLAWLDGTKGITRLTAGLLEPYCLRQQVKERLSWKVKSIYFSKNGFHPWMENFTFSYRVTPVHYLFVMLPLNTSTFQFYYNSCILNYILWPLIAGQVFIFNPLVCQLPFFYNALPKKNWAKKKAPLAIV